MAEEDPPIDPITRDSDTLYDACAKSALCSSEKFKKVFTQDDLLSLCSKDDSSTLSKVISTQTLMPLIQHLSSHNLFISLKQKNSGICWSLRGRDAAKQMGNLNNEEKMVYVMIEESQTNGVWIRHIKKKGNLTDPGANKVVEKLVKMRLVKAVRNVKAPAQKTYMLSHLAPSDDVTGGSFYDGGELDENLVEELGNLIVFHVRQASWVEEKRRKIKSDPAIDDERGSSPEETRGRKKRKVSHSNSKDIEDAGPAKKTHRHEYTHVQLSHPAHHEYPTTQDIHGFITGNNFIRDSKAESLTVDEVQNIVNMLIWDGKLERVNDGYRTVRGVKLPTMSGQERVEGDPFGKLNLKGAEKRGNGLMEMPCGRCPLLDICGKGGPINASSCVYFEQWLGQAVDEQRAGLEVEVVGTKRDLAITTASKKRKSSESQQWTPDRKKKSNPAAPASGASTKSVSVGKKKGRDSKKPLPSAGSGADDCGKEFVPINAMWTEKGGDPEDAAALQDSIEEKGNVKIRCGSLDCKADPRVYGQVQFRDALRRMYSCAAEIGIQISGARMIVPALANAEDDEGIEFDLYIYSWPRLRDRREGLSREVLRRWLSPYSYGSAFSTKTNSFRKLHD